MHNLAYVMPIVRWGNAIQTGLDQGWSRVIDHQLSAMVDGHSGTVEFPVHLDVTYQQGKYDEHGVPRHGYAVDAPFIETPRQARYHYGKRFGMEASNRLSEHSIATTSTRDPVVRLLFVVVSMALQNAWRYLHWEFVSVPRRGGRQLLDWSFGEFLAMLTRAVWTVLQVRRAVPSNKPPDDRFGWYVSAADRWVGCGDTGYVSQFSPPRAVTVRYQVAREPMRGASSSGSPAPAPSPSVGRDHFVND